MQMIIESRYYYWTITSLLTSKWNEHIAMKKEADTTIITIITRRKRASAVADAKNRWRSYFRQPLTQLILLAFAIALPSSIAHCQICWLRIVKAEAKGNLVTTCCLLLMRVSTCSSQSGRIRNAICLQLPVAWVQFSHSSAAVSVDLEPSALNR